MARTKQTARKSTRGKAPRKQLATKSSCQMRSYLLNQQTAGGGSNEKKIFVNCENTLGSFSFKRATTKEVFAPVASFGRFATWSAGTIAGTSPARRSTRSTSGPAATENDTFFMRLDFASNMDGALTTSDRQPLDIVYVVDVSGSMGCNLPDDTDRRSKLQVAADCMRKIAAELKPCDRVGVVTFNTAPATLFPLTRASPENLKKLNSSIDRLNAGGGTALAASLKGGYDILLAAHASDDASFRLRRVVFLTDMESSSYDEDAVIALAHQYASVAVTQDPNHPQNGPSGARPTRKRGVMEAVSDALFGAVPEVRTVVPTIHMTLVGVGVDLSVSAVERISAIPGARYVSVINAAEFFATVVADFNYDVTPLAFDIRLQLPAGLAFERIYGSAELNAVKAGDTEATIASEFPVHLDEQGCTHGGLYICKLVVSDAALLGRAPAMTVAWTDPMGVRHTTQVAVGVPPQNQDPEQVDIGLRKALALVDYVQCLTDFAAQGGQQATLLSGVTAAWNAMMGAGAKDTDCSNETAALLVNIGKDGILSAESADKLPADTPAGILRNYTTAKRFLRLKEHLTAVMAAANDASLTGSNANVLQTIEQVISFETADIAQALSELRTRIGAAAGKRGQRGDVPAGYLCPMSLAVMTDPVVAEDGHSYERAAIAAWFASGQNTSPVTNLRLQSQALAPNHALRASIEEFLQQRARAAAVNEGTAAAAAAVNVGRRRSPRKGVAFKLEAVQG